MTPEEQAAAERAAAEYVAEQFRIYAVRAAADDLAQAVWDDLVSCATANLIGQHGDGDNAANRAYMRLYAAVEEDPDVLPNALVCGLWSFAEEAATRQLNELRDFRYVDRQSGLVPLPPPGRHRAPEEAS